MSGTTWSSPVDGRLSDTDDPAGSSADDRPGSQARRALVDLRDIVVTYGTTAPVHALRGVCVSIQPGELVAVVGPSGSGKSTLLNVMGLLEKPTSGSVVINGVDAATMRDRAQARLRAASIGFVFQAFHLINERTCVENLELALLAQRVPRRQRSARARELIDAVGMSPWADQPCGTLSGGQRQRIAIARALTARPALLLCDEPTGNLDSAASASVLELLGEQNRAGVTVVLVTHDDHVAAWADRRVTVLDGLIA